MSDASRLLLEVALPNPAVETEELLRIAQEALSTLLPKPRANIRRSGSAPGTVQGRVVIKANR